MSGPLKDFHALKPLRKELKAQHEARKTAAAERLRREQQAERESNVFRHSIGPVFPIKSSEKIATHQALPSPRPRLKMHQLDPQAILQASLSDEFSIENLFDGDDHLRFARSGIGPDVLPKLYRGHWAIRQQLDLHGLRIDQARDTLAEFLHLANKRGWRCVRIIHGKGFGSVNQAPVLKGKVCNWLAQMDEVIAFCQANEADGGSGALVVLIKGRTRY